MYLSRLSVSSRVQEPALRGSSGVQRKNAQLEMRVKNLAIENEDLKEICADLKVCGGREMKVLVKWKTKVNKKQEQAKVNLEVEDDVESMSSDEEQLRQLEKKKKKQLKA